MRHLPLSLMLLSIGIVCIKADEEKSDKVRADEEKTDELKADEERIKTLHQPIESPFLEPEEVSDIEDIFTRRTMEYVFINFPTDYSAAYALCIASYRGQLAVVSTTDLAKFLAEALSETNLFLDHLWVGGRLVGDTWHWFEANTISEAVDSEIINSYFINDTLNAKDRACLALGRSNHNNPYFAQLKCNSIQRPFICERQVGGHGHNGTIHPGWIRIGRRLYKIFQERVSWDDAVIKCILFDRDARLAVVVSYLDSQILGRFLLIGRPSLENAWIGAKYYESYYGFSQESLALLNNSDTDGYPPWRNGTMMKPGGCLLLDRHLSNITYFIEARCERLRPYICYKTDIDKQDPSFDIFIDEFGYRVYLKKLPWEGAKHKCDEYAVKYNGALVEIKKRKIVTHLLYIMGENKTTLQHIWLGGTFDIERNAWLWASDSSSIDLSLLDWLTNNTYFETIEMFNTCLNMDRENHVRAIHYGTICTFAQHFICQFPKSDLLKLQRDEAELLKMEAQV